MNQVLTECKETAAKRRRQSTRLENLGIPEEELLRQQQELFARAREAAVEQEQRQGEGAEEELVRQQQIFAREQEQRQGEGSANTEY